MHQQQSYMQSRKSHTCKLHGRLHTCRHHVSRLENGKPQTLLFVAETVRHHIVQLHRLFSAKR